MILIADKIFGETKLNIKEGLINKRMIEAQFPKPAEDTLILACGPIKMIPVVENILFKEMGYDKATQYFKY